MLPTRVFKQLYWHLLKLYPKAFQERLAASMQQTFIDACNEKSARIGLGCILGLFFDTALGIIQEHLSLLQKGGSMRIFVKMIGFSALVGVICVVPLVLLETITRQHLNEEFPVFLFFVMWLNVFAIGLILSPMLLAKSWWLKSAFNDHPIPSKTNQNPRAALMVSMVLILLTVALHWLGTIGWQPLAQLLNGTDQQPHFIGQLLSLCLVSLPITAGVIASGSVATTLRNGGSLFAHPLHLLVAIGVTSLLTLGFFGILMDQWSCFVGIPKCD